MIHDVELKYKVLDPLLAAPRANPKLIVFARASVFATAVPALVLRFPRLCYAINPRFVLWGSRHPQGYPLRGLIPQSCPR